jgi:hypothetical protein
VLLLNQATLLFGHERFAHAGQILEGMFHTIGQADEGVALRVTLLLLEVYLHTYKGAAPGDSVTRSVVSSANRVLVFLHAPHAFNDTSMLIAAIEAARAAAGGHSGSATASASASSASSGAAASSPGSAASADDAPVPIAEGALTSASTISSAGPRRIAGALCGRFWFNLHCIKARFALASKDAATAAAELRAAVSAWRGQILQAGATETAGADASGNIVDTPGTDSCPTTLPAVVGAVEDPDLLAGGTACLPLDLRAQFLHHRSRLLSCMGMHTTAVALLDAAGATAEALGTAPAASGAAAPPPQAAAAPSTSAKGKRGAAAAAAAAAAVADATPLSWPSPSQVVPRASHLSNLALLHARSGRHHLAAALLHRAIAACGDVEATMVQALHRGDAAKPAIDGVTAATAKPKDVAPLAAIKVAPAGTARLGCGVSPVLPPARKEILLNAGITALLRRRPLEAFAHLRRAVMLFRQRPRLWVRLAEACILYHEQCRALTGVGAPSARLGTAWTVTGESARVCEPIVHLQGGTEALGPDGVALRPPTAAPSSSSSASASASGGRAAHQLQRDLCWAGAGVVRAVYGEGSQQRLLLATGPTTCPEPVMRDQAAMRDRALAAATGAPATAASADSIGPLEPDAPSLQYARACLENALCLLPTAAAVAIKPPAVFGTVGDDSEECRAAQGVTARDPAAAASAAAAGSVAVKAAHHGWKKTRAAALTKLAYVCLCLEDPVAALRYANQMSIEPRPDSDPSNAPFLQCWFFSRLYAAEAMCKLDRPGEAADLLAHTEPAPDISPAQASSSRAHGASALKVNIAISSSLANRPGNATEAVKLVLAANPVAVEARAASSLLTQQMGRPTDTRDLLSLGIAPTAVGGAHTPADDARAAAASAAGRG